MATKRASTPKTSRKTSKSAGITKHHLETWVNRAGLEPSVLDALVLWFGKLLASDQFARLEQGGHQEGGIPLRKVFVDLPIGDSGRGHSGSSSGREYLLARLFASKKLDLGDIDELELFRFSDEFRPDAPRHWRVPTGGFLVIGGPGQGKSTLGQLSCQIHRAALLEPHVDQLKVLVQKEVARSFLHPSTKTDIGWPDTIHFPIRIELPRVAPWLLEHEDDVSKIPALLRWLSAEAANRSVTIAPEAFVQLLKHAPMLLVLDGLDEVGAAKDRDLITRSVQELFEALGEDKPHGQVIATTRPQGYAGEFDRLGVALRTVHLLPLDEDEALGYGRKLAQAKYPHQPDEQQRIVQGLAKAAKAPATAHLLTTPLQVTIVAALVLQMGEPPSQRWALFDEYYSTIYKRELERGTYASPLLRDFRTQIRLIHARAGLILQTESEQTGQTRARLSASRLEEIVDGVLADHEEEERKQLVRRIVRAAGERLVFLVEPEPDQFGFEIRSLQEFMAAAALAQDGEERLKARLLQIAPSAMFRSVVIFLASKVFVDGGPLRDFVVHDLCNALDAQNEASQRAKPGAMLALEILEEGSCATHPKHVGVLMEQACRLLDLPPCSEQLRLAQLANDKAQKVLEQQVAKRLRQPQEKEALGAWMALLRAADRNASWVPRVGDQAWNGVKDASAILEEYPLIVNEHQPRLSTWLLDKIEQTMERVSPSALRGWRIARSAQGFVGAFLSVSGLNAATSVSIDYVHLLINDLASNVAWRQLAQWQNPPMQWFPWVRVAHFAIAPTATTLADVLEDLAKHSALDTPVLASALPWPLASCLRCVDSPGELLRYAAMARCGELGDLNEWKDAEKRWRNEFAWDAFFAQTTRILPWDRQQLAVCPPWGSIRHAFRFSRKIWGTFEAPRAIASIQNPPLRRALGNLRSLLLDSLPQAAWSRGSWDDLEALFLEREDVDLLIALRGYRVTSDKQTWLDGLHRLGNQARGFFAFVPENNAAYALREFSRMYRKQPSHTGLLAWIRQILNDVPAADAKEKLLETLHAHPPADDIPKANAITIRFQLGDISERELFDHLELLEVRARQDASLWYALTVRRSKEFPNPELHRALLEKLLRRNDIPLHVVTNAIDSLRTILGKRESGLADPSLWRKLELPLPLPQTSVAVRATCHFSDTPVVLSTTHLQNIRVFSDLSLKLAPPVKDKGQWVVLIGPNGVGKTTLLRAIALTLRDLGNIAIWPKGSFKPDWRSFTTPHATSTISVQLGNGETFTTTIQKNGSEKFVPHPGGAAPFPILAYGCRRGSALGGPLRDVIFDEEEGPEIATLFDEHASLISAQTWLLKKKNEAHEDPSKRPLYDSILEALRKLLDVDDVSMRDELVVSSPTLGQNVPLSVLSDGYLTTAGWFLDLIARYFEWLAEPSRKHLSRSMADMTGLVLIDELDLHLHPYWQVRVIEKVKELLPKMSFVVTTHNPLTLVGARPEEIWILSSQDGKVSAEQGREAPMLLTGGQIYSRYFGIRDLYPSQVGEDLRRYGFLSGDPLRTAEEDAEMQRLRKKLAEKGIEPGWEEVPRQVPQAGKKSAKGARK